MAERQGTTAGAWRIGRGMLLALATQQLLMAYDSTAMNVAISDIVRDLDTTLTGVQSAIALYALVMAVLMITAANSAPGTATPACSRWARSSTARARS